MMIVKKCMIGYNKEHILVEVSRAHKKFGGWGGGGLKCLFYFMLLMCEPRSSGKATETI